MSALAPFAAYEAAALDRAPSAAARARALSVGATRAELEALPDAELWALHAEAMQRWRQGDSGGPPGASLLELKHLLSLRLAGPCRLCFLRCPVDRRRGELGACGLDLELRVYQDFVHWGEEPELVPTHALYLAGCNYRCAYCSDWEQVVDPGGVQPTSLAALAASVDARRAAGALSLSLIGGLPDVNLPGILALLLASERLPPVVWNSNLSATPEAQDLLEGTLDAVVADLKYGQEACAQDGSRVRDSLQVTQRNLRRLAREAYTIVRHLILPGHLECCALPVLQWLAAELPGVRVNLMHQFQPMPQTSATPGGDPWGRRVIADESERALSCARGLELDLRGPGRLPSQLTPEAGRGAAVADHSSWIQIEADGRIVIENLSPELRELVEALGEEVAPPQPASPPNRGIPQRRSRQLPRAREDPAR